MRHPESYVIALRSGGARVFGRRAKEIFAGGTILFVSAALQACSSDPSWPGTVQISDLPKILTPEERQKAIEQLQKNNPSQPASTSKPQQGQ
jgi:hypothetical protein